MKRGKPLKRKPMKRAKGLPRKYQPTKEALTAAQIRARKQFRQAAQDQRVCAVCGRGDSFDAHHVVEKNWLRDNHKPLYVAANSLRLCNRFSKNDCHGKHTRRIKNGHKVKLRQLTTENIEYAFAIMGAAAYDYLRRHYAGSDPRVTALAEEYGIDE
jgi:hypothetical protein